MRSRTMVGSIRIVALLVIAVVAAGCATSRAAGIRTATAHVDAIEDIAKKRQMGGFSEYEGVALVTLGKAGAMGFGLMGASVTVFARDPKTRDFGPPSFVNYVGPSIGLGYGGVDVADCLVLFKQRKDAERLAKRGIGLNFSNEVSFVVWGRKQMTIPGGKSFSDGAGLCLGFIEFEFLFGGPRNSLHRNLYSPDATPDKILSGAVAVPPELKPAMQKLNAVMRR